MEALGGFLGGIGLFLLGMGLMTDGLKRAAGQALARILAGSTRTRTRALASGILLTALVQSSSAVTVATIGFVNAGLLGLGQALFVLFGANVGTTMTGWLVALVGLKFQIEVLALPLIGIGMVLKLTGGEGRRAAFGMALTGFGVLFLGIDLLRQSFTGLSAAVTLPEAAGLAGLLAQIGFGALLTVLMQSSSASLTVALTAAQGGLIGTQGAAAVVIGANIGTTVTAVIAAIGATASAKRAAAAHVVFNVLTGIVALALLPWLIGALAALRAALGMDEAPAAKLALFHTAFNVLGVLLIWPFASRLTRWLQARFVDPADARVRPQHLDHTALAVPSLALSALEAEVRRLGGLVAALVQSALTGEEKAESAAAQARALLGLAQAIDGFVARLQRQALDEPDVVRLAELLRIVRYDRQALARIGEWARWRGGSAAPESLQPVLADFADAAGSLLAEPDADSRAEPADTRLARFSTSYQALKSGLLESAARGVLPVEALDEGLTAASAGRRAIEQLVKARRLTGPAGKRSP